MSRDLRDRISRLVFGMVFTGCGLLVLYLTVTNNLSNSNSTLMGFLAGIMFVVAGVWASGILELFVRNHDQIHGLFIAFMGLMLVVFSLIDDQSSFHAPRWVVTAAGLAFAFPGLWIVLGSIASTYFLKDLLMDVLRNMLVTSFALAAIGVVFSTAIGTQPDLQGILCFSPGALILTLLAIRLWKPTVIGFREKAATDDLVQKRHIRVVTRWLVVGLVVYIGLFVVALLVENGVIVVGIPTPEPR